ncbi:hypothetical protein [Gorillibacterium massiliense]|nr:hypothetical protein [Gorillibacterium massiliense]
MVAELAENKKGCRIPLADRQLCFASASITNAFAGNRKTKCAIGWGLSEF